MGISIEQVDLSIRFKPGGLDHLLRKMNEDEIRLWEFGESSDGSVAKVWFCGEKLGWGEKEELAKAAPFVEPGGWVQMQSEMGDTWRWVFTEDGVQEVYPSVDWSE